MFFAVRAELQDQHGTNPWPEPAHQKVQFILLDGFAVCVKDASITLFYKEIHCYSRGIKCNVHVMAKCS